MSDMKAEIKNAEARARRLAANFKSMPALNIKAQEIIREAQLIPRTTAVEYERRLLSSADSISDDVVSNITDSNDMANVTGALQLATNHALARLDRAREQVTAEIEALTLKDWLTAIDRLVQLDNARRRRSN